LRNSEYYTLPKVIKIIQTMLAKTVAKSVSIIQIIITTEEIFAAIITIYDGSQTEINKSIGLNHYRNDMLPPSYTELVLTVHGA